MWDGNTAESGKKNPQGRVALNDEERKRVSVLTVAVGEEPGIVGCEVCEAKGVSGSTLDCLLRTQD